MKSLEHILEGARKETDLKRLKEIEKVYNSLMNVAVHDEWIGRCKEILGINNWKFYNPFIKQHKVGNQKRNAYGFIEACVVDFAPFL